MTSEESAKINLSLLGFFLLICYGLIAVQKQSADRRHLNSNSRRLDRTTNITVRGLGEYAEIHECSAERTKLIKLAIVEATKLLLAARTPDYDHMPAQEYLGAQWLPIWGESFQKKLNEVFKTAADFILNPIEGAPTPEISCRKDELCSDELRENFDDPIVVRHLGEVDDDNAQISLTVCDAFFKLPSLDHVVNRGRFCLSQGNPLDNRIAFDLNMYDNRALAFAHAIFHTRLVTKGMIENEAPFGIGEPRKMVFEWPHHDLVETGFNTGHWTLVVNPWTAKKLALDRPTNADQAAALGSPTNFALYALAQYLMEELGEYPYAPMHFSEGFTTFYKPREADRACVPLPVKNQIPDRPKSKM
ncbi:hypothetical protein Dda_9057 [Drechslerella dactyloides]|uniref:Uncharacterized protein n=1 Tax=Drechslerella dactyloides TaxID=74499 RepID=A0AAD6NFJ2_DREDA|nr:hypothetical protein Dda_9057 [Drechslerella dactyloides]